MAYETGSLKWMDRMLRAARLNGSLYAEVKVDPTATAQAAIVVVLVGLAHAAGASLRAMILWGEEPVAAFVVAFIAETTFWITASFAIYLVGRYVFGGTASYRQVLRPFGFACVPGLLILFAALASLPGTGIEVPVFAVLIPWRVVAAFVAVRQALSLSHGQSTIPLFAGVIVGLLAVGGVTGALWTILK
jgi:hypothetical protein